MFSKVVSFLTSRPAWQVFVGGILMGYLTRFCHSWILTVASIALAAFLAKKAK